MAILNHSRRTLLKMLGLGAAALTFPDFKLFGGDGKKARIALQLYTVRTLFETDFDGTMQAIADVGFAGIETYPLPAGVPVEHAAKVFKNLGLEVVGMHMDLPSGKQRDTALRMADVYACEKVIYPGWPEGYRDADGVSRVVDVFNETAAFLDSKGLRFGLHNHTWEFELIGGVYPYYYLLQHLDNITFFEIDTYWAKCAGLDPARIVGDFGSRAPLLHIKDGPARKGEESSPQVPAGEGSMNFPAIAEAGKGNTQWMIVEFDTYEKNLIDGIRKSYAFLTQRGLAEGKI